MQCRAQQKLPSLITALSRSLISRDIFGTENLTSAFSPTTRSSMFSKAETSPPFQDEKDLLLPSPSDGQDPYSCALWVYSGLYHFQYFDVGLSVLHRYPNSIIRPGGRKTLWRISLFFCASCIFSPIHRDTITFMTRRLSAKPPHPSFFGIAKRRTSSRCQSTILWRFSSLF